MIPATLPGWLARWAADAPARPFLTGQSLVTFGDAARVVSERATAMRSALGDRESDPIVVTGPAGASLALDVLAALEADIPVVLAPPGWTGDELTNVAALAGARTVVRQGVIQKLPADGGAERSPWPGCRAALAFPTSGSTGTPRLALRSAASLESEGRRWTVAYGSSAKDTILCSVPIAHAFGFGAALAAAVVSGCALHIAPFESARGLAADIEEHHATIVPMVGAIARALAMLGGGSRVESALRFAVVGAGPCPRALSDDFASKWGLPLAENYGSSETGAVLLRPAQVAEGTGLPMDGIEVALDPGEGEIAQIWIRSSTPPLGHITEGGFEPARLAPGKYWPMGDLARLGAGGMVHLVGRLGRQIRRGGHTIVPGEVAQALLGHEAVADAVITAGDDGLGEQAVEAHIALRPGRTATPKDLQTVLIDRLATYKWPTRWFFHDELPKTWSGKAVTPRGPTESAAVSKSFAAMLSHRVSAALVAAEQVGLLNALEAPSSAPALANALGLDPHALTVLLDVLCAAGLVRHDAGAYRMAEATESWRRPVLELEGLLRDGWLHPGAIAGVLRSGTEQRAFERAPDRAFARAYRDAVSGPAQTVLATRALRCVEVAQSVLEIGRGIGALGELAHRRGCGRYRAVPLAPEPAIVSPWLECRSPGSAVTPWDGLGLGDESYDLVYVLNGVHWIGPGLRPVLGDLLRAVAPGGRLVIADVFAPATREPASGEALLRATLGLDWLTHGGIHLLNAEDVSSALRAHGAGSIDRIRCTGLLYELLSASRTPT